LGSGNGLIRRHRIRFSSPKPSWMGASAFLWGGWMAVTSRCFTAVICVSFFFPSVPLQGELLDTSRPRVEAVALSGPVWSRIHLASYAAATQEIRARGSPPRIHLFSSALFKALLFQIHLGKTVAWGTHTHIERGVVVYGEAMGKGGDGTSLVSPFFQRTSQQRPFRFSLPLSGVRRVGVSRIISRHLGNLPSEARRGRAERARARCTYQKDIRRK
jgi:hypothetical protein